MTVKELMKQLEELPQEAKDTEVIAYNKETKTYQDIKNIRFGKWNDKIKFVFLHNENKE